MDSGDPLVPEGVCPAPKQESPLTSGWAVRGEGPASQGVCSWGRGTRDPPAASVGKSHSPEVLEKQGLQLRKQSHKLRGI